MERKSLRFTRVYCVFTVAFTVRLLCVYCGVYCACVSFAVSQSHLAQYVLPKKRSASGWHIPSWDIWDDFELSSLRSRAFYTNITSQYLTLDDSSSTWLQLLSLPSKSRCMGHEPMCRGQREICLVCYFSFVFFSPCPPPPKNQCWHKEALCFRAARYRIHSRSTLNEGGRGGREPSKNLKLSIG